MMTTKPYRGGITKSKDGWHNVWFRAHGQRFRQLDVNLYEAQIMLGHAKIVACLVAALKLACR